MTHTNIITRACSQIAMILLHGGGADVRGVRRAPRLLQRVLALRQGRCTRHD